MVPSLYIPVGWRTYVYDSQATKTVPSSEESDKVSLLRRWRRGGPIHISTSDTPAAQECTHSAMQMQKDNHTVVK